MNFVETQASYSLLRQGDRHRWVRIGVKQRQCASWYIYLLDGSLKYDAHAWSEICNLNCLRLLFTTVGLRNYLLTYPQFVFGSCFNFIHRYINLITKCFLHILGRLSPFLFFLVFLDFYVIHIQFVLKRFQFSSSLTSFILIVLGNEILEETAK